MINRRDFIALGAASLTVAAMPASGLAQARFPERPIKLVVPFSAGGVNDIVGRQWAEKMRTSLGSVFVENQGGAGGTLGVIEVKRADPDGHTILLGSGSTMMMNELTTSNLPYDSSKDFVPIAIFCVSTTSIAVHASVPAKNVKELIDYAKANPGKLSYGSAGTGTMSHLSGELFKLRTGLSDVVHIPYKGAGPGIADLVSGHIPMMSQHLGADPELPQQRQDPGARHQFEGEIEGCARHSDRHRTGRSRHDRGAVPRHLRADRDAPSHP